MMMNKSKSNPLALSLLVFLLVAACQPKAPSRAELIEEVRATELAFSASAQEIGVKEAFLKFASDDCALKRGGRILKGKAGVEEAYANFSPTATLEWSPDFVDVSASGDLAYTYGPFKFTDLDSMGVRFKREGIFHTVWKRMPDGSWKFVWD